jgi:hypothetical protein
MLGISQVEPRRDGITTLDRLTLTPGIVLRVAHGPPWGNSRPLRSNAPDVGGPTVRIDPEVRPDARAGSRWQPFDGPLRHGRRGDATCTASPFSTPSGRGGDSMRWASDSPNYPGAVGTRLCAVVLGRTPRRAGDADLVQTGERGRRSANGRLAGRATLASAIGTAAYPAYHGPRAALQWAWMEVRPNDDPEGRITDRLITQAEQAGWRKRAT